MDKPQIDQLKTLLEGRYLNMYRADYKDRKGNDRHWLIASRKPKATYEAQFFNPSEATPDAVVLVAHHIEADALVFIRQYRVPLNDFIYELPAGLIDAGENPVATIERELKEETGLDLIAITHLKDNLYLSPGMTDESITFAFCTCKGELSTAYLEADELIEPLFITKDQAITLLATKEKLDIKCYLVLLQFVAGTL